MTGFETLPSTDAEGLFDYKQAIPPEDLAWVDLVRGTMLNIPMNAYATYHFTATMLAERVPGAFVECGVFAGAHPAIMWKAMERYGEFRPIHLFDSFEGIPHAGEHDTDNIGGTLFDCACDGELVSSGISVCSIENVKKNFRRWGVCTADMEFHKGWVERTLEPTIEAIAPVAFARIDVDLYSGTRTCLKHLLPAMSEGGIVVLDDYNLKGAKKAILEFIEKEQIRPIDGKISMYARIARGEDENAPSSRGEGT